MGCDGVDIMLPILIKLVYYGIQACLIGRAARPLTLKLTHSCLVELRAILAAARM